MSDDFSNPSLPGKGIEAAPAEPPFNRAAGGEVVFKPEVLKQQLNLNPPGRTPDGRTIVPSRTNDERMVAVANRAARVQESIDKDGITSRNMPEFRRDFEDAHEHRR